MFFILSKLLVFLTKPFLILSTLLIVSFIIKNKLWEKRLRILVLAGFVLTANGILIGELMRAWEIPAIKISDLAGNYGVGIVLGGGADVERRPKDRLFLQNSGERITHAVHLYKAGKIKKILYTGGKPEIFENPEVDNDAIVNFYIDCGIPSEDIIIESKSRNTHENAIFTADLVDKSKQHILITSAFHMRRAAACFEKEGINVVPFSCDFNSPKDDDRFSVSELIPSVDAMGKWEILLKEWAGMIAYKMAGYI